ncbi:hemerythrin [Andreprevotia lacus DSM 23236]|jgi:hemerythrin|uniref:Hemerythrin n=1 Tax=Andreprevotia lacus DSM 23236 TaxID=1121001 RepID=A0A1W1XQG0_9NEIS|nr:bacteriohemerythrin [Andreprevotia lacus]SMC26095.1 hemerythrin [Andreprevotia lacus DSM 23236]
MEQLIVWSDELSVGIQEIDEQHKVLVGLLNELYDAIRHHHGRQASVEILNRLADYTRIHFTVEESLMRILGYPDYEGHKAHHEDLITQMQSLQQRLAAGETVTFELLHFLRNWLTRHIQEGDRRYTEHFLSRGAQRSWHKKSWLERFWSH